IAQLWERIAVKYRGQPGFDEAFLPGGRAPRPGEIFFNRPLARSLEQIAETKGAALYSGSLGEARVAHSAAHGGAMAMTDLGEHRVDWCGTLAQGLGGLDVHEIPPNGQGIATLMALGILKHLDVTRFAVDSVEALHLQIEAMKLAFADVQAFV